MGGIIVVNLHSEGGTYDFDGLFLIGISNQRRIREKYDDKRKLCEFFWGPIRTAVPPSSRMNQGRSESSFRSRKKV